MNELHKHTTAILKEGRIYGLKEGAYVDDGQMLLPHDAIRHHLPDGVQAIRATGERTYEHIRYTPEEYDGNPHNLTGIMPTEDFVPPERGRRTRPGPDRMRPVPDMAASKRNRTEVQSPAEPVLQL